MKEQSNRRSSSGSVPGAVFFPNHMNSYPVLSDSYIERLLGTPTIRSRASRARGYVLFAQGQKALGVYVVWEGRVKISIGSDQGKSMILALVTRGRSRAAGDNPGFAVCRDGRGGGTGEGEFRLARRSLEAFARDRRCGLHSRGKPQRDLLLDAGGVQDDPPVSVGGAEDGPLPSGTSPHAGRFERRGAGGTRGQPRGNRANDWRMPRNGGAGDRAPQKETNTRIGSLGDCHP